MIVYIMFDPMAKSTDSPIFPFSLMFQEIVVTSLNYEDWNR